MIHILTVSIPVGSPPLDCAHGTLCIDKIKLGGSEICFDASIIIPPEVGLIIEIHPGTGSRILTVAAKG